MLRIIHNLGGCGGTLLSRCLGVLPGTALLSEVNPLSVHLFASFSPLYQDRNWLHLLSEEDLEKFSGADLGDPANFRDIVGALHAQAESRGRILILRDYNYVDFVGIPFLDSPPRKRVIYDALPSGVAIRAIAFVRHPIDQYLSLSKHEALRTVLRPAQFCDAYATFLRDLRDTPVFRYEDFVCDAENELRCICSRLELPFDPRFQHEFFTFPFVTGDFSRQSDTTISLPPRAQLPEHTIEEFQASRSFEQVLSHVGYTMDRAFTIKRNDDCSKM